MSRTPLPGRRVDAPLSPPPATYDESRPSQVAQETRDIRWNNPFLGNPPSVHPSPVPRVSLPKVSKLPLGPSETRRESDVSTLAEERQDPYKKLSLSSYQHPHDIQPPPNAYSGSSAPPNTPLRSALRRPSVTFAQQPGVKEYQPEEEFDPKAERVMKRRGVPSQMLDLYALDRSIDLEKQPSSPGSSLHSDDYSYKRPNFRRIDSTASTGSEVLDPDDPRVTGIRREHLEDPEDIEKNVLRKMDYRSRRKHLMRVRIEFNVSCKYFVALFSSYALAMINRQEFLIKLARALMTFGAPSHRIESQLVAAARILEVEAEFIHLPGVIICSFGDQELGCSETHFVKCGGRLSLGALHKVHLIYRGVVHDEISARRATGHLEDLLNAPPLYSVTFRCILAFFLSALICPLAFGGSFLDMWIAGTGAFFLSTLQLRVATKSALYANVFE